MIVVEHGRRLIGEETDVDRDERAADGRGANDLRAAEARGRRASVKWARGRVVAAGRGDRFGRPKAVSRPGRACRWSDGRFAPLPRCPRSTKSWWSPKPESIDADARLCARSVAPIGAARGRRGGATRQESVSQRSARGVRTRATRCSCTTARGRWFAPATCAPRCAGVRAGTGVAAGGAASSTRSKSSIRHRDACVATLDRDDACGRRRRRSARWRPTLGGARARASRADREATDDAALLEASGVEVIAVAASQRKLQGDAAGRRRARRSDCCASAARERDDARRSRFRRAPPRRGSRAGAGRRSRARSSAARSDTPTPTCSRTRSPTRCWARPRSAIWAGAFPNRPALEGCRLDGAAGAVRAGRARRRLRHRQRRRDDRRRSSEARAAYRGDARERRGASRASRSTRVSVKAKTQRGHGLYRRRKRHRRRTRSPYSSTATNA